MPAGGSTPACELAGAAHLDFQIDESLLPVAKPVKAACELLGFDPLFVANEGCAAIFVSPESVDATLAILKRHSVMENARVIGEVGATGGHVSARTALGTLRRLMPPSGEQLPRIC